MIARWVRRAVVYILPQFEHAENVDMDMIEI